MLRKRVEFLSPTSPSPSDPWLPLLSWKAEKGKRLLELVTNSDAFEPHPSSGEIETGTIEPVVYRVADYENFVGKVTLPDLGLEIMYMWRDGEEEEEERDWRIAEVLPITNDMASAQWVWYPSVKEAEQAPYAGMTVESLRQDNDRESQSGTPRQPRDTDDSYWDLYDKTPGSDPSTAQGQTKRADNTSEAEYFDRYAHVQPEMDDENPSQNEQDIQQETSNGTVSTTFEQYYGQPESPMPGEYPSIIPRLERAADTQSVTMTAVRQHVSASLKGLFRLCRGTGMDMAEFKELVGVEMQALSIFDEPDVLN